MLSGKTIKQDKLEPEHDFFITVLLDMKEPFICQGTCLHHAMRNSKHGSTK